MYTRLYVCLIDIKKLSLYRWYAYRHNYKHNYRHTYSYSAIAGYSYVLNW